MIVYSKNFQRYINEVFFITPNDLGNDFLNKWFKRITFFLKKSPFLLITPLTMIFVLLFYFIFGKYIILLTNFLQYGF